MTAVPATLLIESHRHWWELAGLDTLVDDEPVNWLASPQISAAPQRSETAAAISLPSDFMPPVQKVERHSPVAPTVPVAPAALAPLAMPDEWSAFQSWLAQDASVPGTRWHPTRVLPAGPVAAPLMVLALTPELADHDAGSLFAGDAGQLLDAMLRAIGLTRAESYLASLALTRPPGGRIDASELALLTPLLWHHLALARPERLLLLGSDLTMLAAATDLASARGRLLNINHDGVTVTAAAIQHPLLLLDRPARKAAAWDSLKLLRV